MGIGYDALGQVTSGKKYWPDGTPVAGQQFEYNFDDIGNRTSTGWGGDGTPAANLHYQGYAANNLNQYTSRGNPPFYQITGNASSAANISAWSDWGGNATLYRQGNYFMAEWYFDTSWLVLPVWTTINVEAAIPGGGPSGADLAAIGPTTHAYIPPTSESFTYDLDGNLTQDARWQYTWDAENRLVSVKAYPNGPLLSTDSMWKLDFVYDAQGRRTQKIASQGYWYYNYYWQIGWSPLYTNTFIYDGWNLIAELTGASPSTSTLLRSYTWGTDLSGSTQAAGGVGGLLALNYHGAQTTNCFVACDGNGNVTALVDAANGTIAAQYDYGPFGEVIRATGPMAKVNPLRFSSKYQDDETDMLIFPCRPWRDGRFLTRDPAEEPGCTLLLDDVADDEDDQINAGNLYRFAVNNPVSTFDGLGLWPSSSPFLGFLIGGTPLTHQKANKRELPVSPGELFVINYASVAVDADQVPADSFKHAMRDGTAPQSDADARASANDFVKHNLSQAEDLLCNCGDAVSYLHALEFFGYALHTVQDSTSPAHNGRRRGGPIQFKPWHGLSGPVNWGKALRHVKMENFDPGQINNYGETTALDDATKDLWKYFTCKHAAPAFPTDFFTFGIDTKDGGREH
jgi:RHS repeat-associated protein